MKKAKFIAAICVFFAIEGVFLMIYGFAAGANFWAIVNVFSSYRSPLSVKEYYILLGLLRTMIASLAIKEGKPRATRRSWSERTKRATKRATMIVAGIFFVYLSISGVVYSLVDGGITVSNEYGIVIEFIVTFILSLYYLIYAFRFKVGPL